MPITANDAIRLIERSDQVSDEARLDIFEFLATSFSLIPLAGGFPAPGQSAREFKRPLESNWNQWCETKRPFSRADFAPERAGVACGPASGVLVLDVDDMDAFWNWQVDQDIPVGLPPTLTVKTGGEGERYHFYFLYPDDGQRYGCRSVKGVFDIRGVGGQVLCPGSLHPETRKPYTLQGETFELALAPDWLRHYTLTKTTKPASPVAESPTPESTKDTPMTPDSTPLPSIMTDPAAPAPSTPVLATLPVSEKIKQMITTAVPKGQRSEASMTVLVGMLSAGIDEATVKQIYASYPIGEKAREAGAAWLDREIAKAKDHIATAFDNSKSSARPADEEDSQARKYTYETFNALDVINSTSDFEFLIENFWPKAEPLLVTGPGGAGKSIMTLQIAMDLIFPPAAGFLNAFKVSEGAHKVLFVQSENTFIGMKKRFATIRSAYSIPDAVLREGIFFLGVNKDIRSVGDMMRGSFREVIKEKVALHEADILIIDPLISFHNLDENSNDQMRKLLDQVSLLAEEVHVSPLLIHHHGKFATDSGAGGGRGASAIGDWSPNTWELSFHKQSKQYSLQHNKARNFMLQEKVTLELDHLRFKKVGSATVVGEIQYVELALNNLNGTASSMKELKDEIIKLYAANNNGKPISENTAGSYIKKAVEAGNVKASPVSNSNSKMYTF